MAQLLAAGAFAGLALLSWRERQGKQSDNKPVSKTYEIESKHVALIEKMVGEYKIPSNDKAYRVAVQYAISDGNTNDIFKLKRCNTCGGRKKKVKVQIELYDKQHLYLESMKTTFGMKSVDKALRCVLEYAETDGDRATIFSEKRCKNC